MGTRCSRMGQIDMILCRVFWPWVRRLTASSRRLVVVFLLFWLGMVVGE